MIFLCVCGGSSRPGMVLTVQALSDDDYRFWIHAMGGKEPVRKSFALNYLNYIFGKILVFNLFEKSCCIRPSMY